MNAPLLQIIDDALPPGELKFWQEKVKTGKESTVMEQAEAEDTLLFQYCNALTGNLQLIHCLLFNVKKEHHTEMHCDTGEYATLFYPFDHPTAGLKLKNQEIEVRQNRLVLLNCTEVEHMQKKPEDDSIRYSVALKWRLP